MTTLGLATVLALSMNASFLKTSHGGIDVPFFNQTEQTIYFPCHNEEAPSPVGQWSGVTSMEEVYYILGMFYKETSLQDAKAWVARTPNITQPWKDRLLSADTPGSLDVLYRWCVAPYLEEQST